MENLADPSGEIAMIFKMFRPHRSVANDRTRRFVTEHFGGVGVISGHEGSAGRPAIGPLTIGASETRSLICDGIDVGCLAHFVPVARQRGIGKVV